MELAEAARALVAEAALPDPETKPDRSLVTAIDRNAQGGLREMIADRFPSTASRVRKGRMWRRTPRMSGCWTRSTALRPLSRTCRRMVR
jgi:hypothetical protein